MTEEQRLVYVRSIFPQAEICMQGMIAENKQREILGKSMAYTESDFASIIDEYAINHNALSTEICGH